MRLFSLNHGSNRAADITRMHLDGGVATEFHPRRTARQCCAGTVSQTSFTRNAGGLQPAGDPAHMVGRIDPWFSAGPTAQTYDHYLADMAKTFNSSELLAWSSSSFV